MNRHNPIIRRTTVSSSPALIYEPAANARSIAAVVENHGTVEARIIFTDTGVDPDPDAYITLGAGMCIEVNPDIKIWAYTPSGVSCAMVVSTGVRHIGIVDTEADLSLSATVDQLSVLRQQKQLLAELVIGQGLILRYLAEIYGKEITRVKDALKIQ